MENVLTPPVAAGLISFLLLVNTWFLVLLLWKLGGKWNDRRRRRRACRPTMIGSAPSLRDTERRCCQPCPRDRRP